MSGRAQRPTIGYRVFQLSLLVLLYSLSAIHVPAQTKTVYDINHLKSFQKQLQHDHITNWISPDEATKLLIEKSNPAVKSSKEEGHHMGTVIVSFELTQTGEIQHATIMSGPKELQKPVLKAVEQYKYKPYLLNGTPSTVATSVSVTVYDY
jgi:hypothetical protein